MSWIKSYKAVMASGFVLLALALSGCTTPEQPSPAPSATETPRTIVEVAPKEGVSALFDKERRFVRVVKPESKHELESSERLRTFDPEMTGGGAVYFEALLPGYIEKDYWTPKANIYVTIGLYDAIDYLNTHPDNGIVFRDPYDYNMPIWEDEGNDIQRGVAQEIAHDINAYYGAGLETKLLYEIDESKVDESERCTTSPTYFYDSTQLMTDFREVVLPLLSIPKYDSLTYEFSSEKMCIY